MASTGVVRGRSRTPTGMKKRRRPLAKRGLHLSNVVTQITRAVSGRPIWSRKINRASTPLRQGRRASKPLRHRTVTRT